MKISSFCDLEKSLDRLQQRQKFENFVFDQNFDFEEAIPSKNFPLSPENIFRVVFSASNEAQFEQTFMVPRFSELRTLPLESPLNHTLVSHQWRFFEPTLSR